LIFAPNIKFQTIWKSFGLGFFFGSKGVCYVRQLKVHVILGQFSVLSVFLLSLLSLLAFVLGSVIKKKNAKGVLQSGFHVFRRDIMAKEEEDSKGEVVSKGEK
jgi:hypothetical protein